MRDELTSALPELSPAKIQQALDMAEAAGAKPDWKNEPVSEGTVADPFPPLTSVRLTRTLAVATRAEQNAFEYRTNAGIPHWESYRTELGAADALWYCCAGHENTVVYFTGPHPFKYMCCYRCEHKICQRCHTTASGLIETLPGGHRSYRATDKDIREERATRWCMVCPRCALSYRAAKRWPSLHLPAACHCGHAFGPNWAQFLIGSVHQIRRNPHHVSVLAKNRWKMLQPVVYAKRSYDTSKEDVRQRQTARNMPRIVVYDPDVSLQTAHRSPAAFHTALLPSDLPYHQRGSDDDFHALPLMLALRTAPLPSDDLSRPVSSVQSIPPKPS